MKNKKLEQKVEGEGWIEFDKELNDYQLRVRLFSNDEYEYFACSNDPDYMFGSNNYDIVRRKFKRSPVLRMWDLWERWKK